MAPIVNFIVGTFLLLAFLIVMYLIVGIRRAGTILMWLGELHIDAAYASGLALASLRAEWQRRRELAEFQANEIFTADAEDAKS